MDGVPEDVKLITADEFMKMTHGEYLKRMVAMGPKLAFIAKNVENESIRNALIFLLKADMDYSLGDAIEELKIDKEKFDLPAIDVYKENYGDYITYMADVMVGDIDPQVEFDVESDEQHRYVTFKILDKVLLLMKIKS